MIKHIVMFKIKGTDTQGKQENMDQFRDLLNALPPKIPVLKKMEVGFDFSKKPAAFDLVLTTYFDDTLGLKEYVSHPEHQKVVEFIKEIVTDRAVVDYEI